MNEVHSKEEVSKPYVCEPSSCGSIGALDNLHIERLTIAGEGRVVVVDVKHCHLDCLFAGACTSRKVLCNSHLDTRSHICDWQTNISLILGPFSSITLQ